MYRLCGIAFGTSPMFLLGACLLTLNPLIEDHMSVGRGYSLALAFFAWAFVAAIGSLQQERRLPRVGLLLALSVGANLTFLFPVAALLAIVTLIVLRNGSSLMSIVRELLGPWLVLTFLFLVLPFSNMVPGQLYFGANTIRLSAQTLLEALDRRPAHRDYADNRDRDSCVRRLRGNRSHLMVPAHGPERLRAARDRDVHTDGVHDDRGPCTIWSAVSAGLCCTGLYFLFLLALCLLPLWRRWWFGAGAMPIALLCVVMAQGIRLDRYMEWRFELLQPRHHHPDRIQTQGADSRPVRILCSRPMWPPRCACIAKCIDWIGSATSR